MITIRPYRELDEAAVLGLARELHGHERGIIDPTKPASEIGAWYIDRLKSQCAQCAGEILVAICEGTIAGYASVLSKVKEEDKGGERDRHHALVGELAVAAGFRRRGIARALLAACEQFARTAGRDDFRIGVLAANATARRLYLRAGFKVHAIDMRKHLA